MFDYKLTFCQELGRDCEWFDKGYKTQSEATLALNAIALYTLHLHKVKAMPDHSNMGFVSKWDNEEKEWYSIEEDDEEVE